MPAAADEIATFGEELGLDDEHIVPDMSQLDLFPREAVAVGMKAVEQGWAGFTPSREELLRMTTDKINSSREMIEMMMREGAIAPIPRNDRSRGARPRPRPPRPPAGAPVAKEKRPALY